MSQFKLLLNVLNKPWLVEPAAAVQMLGTFERLHSGAIATFKDESPYAFEPSKFFQKSGVTVAPTTQGGLGRFKGFDGAKVAVIPVSGPLMKSDSCGDLGTASMRAITQQAIDAASVQTIVFVMDTPGGTVDGTQAFADLIKGAGKRTVCMVDEMMCSAGYWIGSSCDEIYATNTTAMIGSIGTMCSFYDDSSYMEKKGIVLREYYATASTDKNLLFKEAIAGDGTKLVQEMLDPLNDNFLSAVRTNRAGKIKGNDVLTGKVYLAKDAVANGLIDGIKTLEQVLQTAKSRKMTAAEYKAAHPQEHAAIFADGISAGVTQERNRIAGWEAWRETDAAAVAAGIASGAVVDSTVISQMSAKASNKVRLQAVEKDNAPAVETPTEAETHKTEEAAQTEAYSNEVLKAMGIRK